MKTRLDLPADIDVTSPDFVATLNDRLRRAGDAITAAEKRVTGRIHETDTTASGQPNSPNSLTLTVPSLTDDPLNFAIHMEWPVPAPPRGAVGYEREVFYYDDEALTVPGSEWINLGVMMGLETTSADNGSWPRPGHDQWLIGRVRSVAADNQVSAWVLTATATHLDAFVPGAVEAPAAPSAPAIHVIDSGDAFGLGLSWTPNPTLAGTVGYECEVRYYSDAGLTTPESGWMFLTGVTLGSALTSAENAGPWPRPNHDQWVMGRVRALNAANTTTAWVETASAAALAHGSVYVSPPPQPTDLDWTLAVISNGHNDATGANITLVRATVTTTDPDANVYSMHRYKGASAPTDPSRWVDISNNQARAATGSTILEDYVDRESASVRYWYCLVASSTRYIKFPDAVSSAKYVDIAPAGIPAQVSGFSITLYTSPPTAGPGTTGGLPSGQLEFNFTAPAGDLDWWTTSIYRRFCTDASYATPVSGALGLWHSVFSKDTSFRQTDWWPLGDAQFSQWKIQSVSRAVLGGEQIENTTSAPTVNLAIPASTGIDMSKVNGTTVGAGLQVAGGRLGIKTSSTVGVDGGNNVIVNPDSIANTHLKLASVGSGNLIDGSLGDLAKYATDKRPVVIVPGLPGLPNTSYPNGAIIFNTATGKLYRNNGGAWTAGSDPADLIAGTIAVGVTYAGYINVSQLVAGSATFTGDVYFQRSFGAYIAITSAGISIKNSLGLGLTISQYDGSMTYDTGVGFYTVITGNSITTQTFSALFASVSGSSSYFNTTSSATYRVNGSTVINSSGAFVGAGVSCTANGVGGTGHNVYQSGWYYGVTGPSTFTTTDGKTVTVRGGIITSIV